MDKTLQLKIITALQDKLSGPLKKMMGASGKSAKSLKDLRDKLKDLDQAQKNVGRFRELSGGLRKTQEQVHQAQGRVAELAQQLRTTEHPTKALQREFNQATRASRSLKQEFRQQSQKLQEMRDRLSTAGISTRNLSSAERDLRGRITQTTDALRRQEQQLAKTHQRQRQLTEAKERMDRGLMRTGAMAGTGWAARATGMRVGAGMRDLLHVGYDFDAQMSATQAVTRIDDKNDPRMQALRHQARTLPLSSKFTDLEVAQGQFYLGRTGYSPEQIRAAMPAMLDLAAAGDLDLGTTADIASNIQTAMRIPAENMRQVADVLTAAFTRNNVDIPMLGESLKYSAVVGKEFNQSLPTITAATALLGSAGIQGSMAGTSMRAILSRIGNSKAVAKLGVRTQDKNGNLRELPDIMADIAKATEKMGNVERSYIFEKISGRYAMSAFGALIDATREGRFQGMTNDLSNSTKGEGEAARVAKTQLDNLKGDLTFVHAGFENLSVELFEKNDSLFRRLAQSASHYLHELAEFLKAHPAVSKAIVILGGGLAALLVVFGSLTIALAGILGPFIMLRFATTFLGLKVPGLAMAFRALTAPLRWLGRLLPLVGRGILFIGRALMLNPIGLAVTAIALAGYLIYQYWEPIKAFFSGLWDTVTTKFNDSVKAISTLIKTWDPLTFFRSAFDGVIQFLGTDLPAKFMEFGTMIIQGLINGIKSMPGAVKDAVVSTAGDAVEWFKEKLGINSPSRVFMELGGFVTEGAALGIKQRQPLAEKAAQLMAAGVLAAGAMTPAQAAMLQSQALTFDTRPPITAAQVRAAGLQAAGGPGALAAASGPGDHIEIHIHPVAGSNPQDIAQAVARELDRRDREKRARARSALADYDN
ncbi:MAG: phage tail tape measure protein [Paracoccus sp. (in: a-proteobacteria)]